MGTRGAVGVLVGGVTKATYNHFDSYPSFLGKHVADEVRELMAGIGITGLQALCRNLHMVDTSVEKPTPEIKAKLRPITDLGVSRQSEDDWYCLFRKAQGSLKTYLEVGLMPDGGKEFMAESLFCEWAYIVNVDDAVLEVYRGFQRDKHAHGRYATAKAPRDGYWPVALVRTYPLDAIPTDWVEIEAAICSEENEEEDEDA